VSAERLLRRLSGLQESMGQRVAVLGPERYRRQFHPELSPGGWHLGHCVYTEDYWIGKALLPRGTPETAATQAARGRALYAPECSPKRIRGGRLLALEEMLAWAGMRQRENRQRLRELRARGDERKLLDRHYLLHFLVQHYAQHHETLRMIEAQLQKAKEENRAHNGATRAPRNGRGGNENTACACRRKIACGGRPAMRNGMRNGHPRGCAPGRDTATLPPGRYRIGADNPHAPYDNEYGAVYATLGAVALERRPASNARYLEFLEAGGYRRREYWSPRGWKWRLRQRIEAPEYWRQARDGDWYAVGPGGAEPLRAEDAVYGISHFEASAFAAWNRARLPHEYEWEAARRQGLLDGVGQVWEWCANPLHPYPGFRPYPYPGYSIPYFDGEHRVLRGGSRHTQPEIRRHSFRNYYPPGTRHLFAGVRLAYNQGCVRQGSIRPKSGPC